MTLLSLALAAQVLAAGFAILIARRRSAGISECECNCGGCVLVGELFIAAHREVTGRE